MSMPLAGLTKKIVDEWNKTKSSQQLADKYGVSRQAIYNLLHKQGIKTPRRLRPPRKCKSCERMFVPKGTNGQTCSPECARVLTRKTLIERAKNLNLKWTRLLLLDLKCDHCGKAFQRTQYNQSIAEYYCNEGKKNFCSPKCNVHYQHGK